MRSPPIARTITELLASAGAAELSCLATARSGTCRNWLKSDVLLSVITCPVTAPVPRPNRSKAFLFLAAAVLVALILAGDCGPATDKVQQAEAAVGRTFCIILLSSLRRLLCKAAFRDAMYHGMTLQAGIRSCSAVIYCRAHTVFLGCSKHKFDVWRSIHQLLSQSGWCCSMYHKTSQ